MWNDLLAVMDKYKDAEWIIGGDFNAKKDIRERKGRSRVVSHIEVEAFVEFIHKRALVDTSCKGEKYTWYSGDGRTMSRIDRFLFSVNVVNRWGIVGQLVGNRDISDHFPVWLMSDNSNWDPKPIKFNKKWFSLDSFVPFVEKEWNSLNIEGRGDFILKEKLILLKNKLRRHYAKFVF